MPSIIDIQTKKAIKQTLKRAPLSSEEEQALFILKLLKQHDFSSEQFSEAKRFIRKQLRYFSFKEIIIDLSLMLNCGEAYFLNNISN